MSRFGDKNFHPGTRGFVNRGRDVEIGCHLQLPNIRNAECLGTDEFGVIRASTNYSHANFRNPYSGLGYCVVHESDGTGGPNLDISSQDYTTEAGVTSTTITGPSGEFTVPQGKLAIITSTTTGLRVSPDGPGLVRDTTTPSYLNTNATSPPYSYITQNPNVTELMGIQFRIKPETSGGGSVPGHDKYILIVGTTLGNVREHCEISFSVSPISDIANAVGFCAGDTLTITNDMIIAEGSTMRIDGDIVITLPEVPTSPDTWPWFGPRGSWPYICEAATQNAFVTSGKRIVMDPSGEHVEPFSDGGLSWDPLHTQHNHFRYASFSMLLVDPSGWGRNNTITPITWPGSRDFTIDNQNDILVILNSAGAGKVYYEDDNAPGLKFILRDNSGVTFDNLNELDPTAAPATVYAGADYTNSPIGRVFPRLDNPAFTLVPWDPGATVSTSPGVGWTGYLVSQNTLNDLPTTSYSLNLTWTSKRVTYSALGSNDARLWFGEPAGTLQKRRQGANSSIYFDNDSDYLHMTYQWYDSNNSNKCSAVYTFGTFTVDAGTQQATDWAEDTNNLWPGQPKGHKNQFFWERLTGPGGFTMHNKRPYYVYFLESIGVGTYPFNTRSCLGYSVGPQYDSNRVYQLYADAVYPTVGTLGLLARPYLWLHYGSDVNNIVAGSTQSTNEDMTFTISTDTDYVGDHPDPVDFTSSVHTFGNDNNNHQSGIFIWPPGGIVAVNTPSSGTSWPNESNHFPFDEYEESRPNASIAIVPDGSDAGTMYTLFSGPDDMENDPTGITTTHGLKLVKTASPTTNCTDTEQYYSKYDGSASLNTAGYANVYDAPLIYSSGTSGLGKWHDDTYHIGEWSSLALCKDSTGVYVPLMVYTRWDSTNGNKLWFSKAPQDSTSPYAVKKGGFTYANHLQIGTDETGEYCKIAVNDGITANGRFYMVYYDTTNKNLKFVYFINSTQVQNMLDPTLSTNISTLTLGIDYFIETIDSRNDVGKYASMCVVSHDLETSIHVAYHDSTNKSLKYARKIINYGVHGSWGIQTALHKSDTDVFETLGDGAGNLITPDIVGEHPAISAKLTPLGPEPYRVAIVCSNRKEDPVSDTLGNMGYSSAAYLVWTK
ncbi:MAG: hypothetical protein CMM25_08245 [Rhodospirillaceae bacterium]|nr:hypothetical protein [Rhodospirillaceae bacterium]